MNIDKLFKKTFKNFGDNFQSSSITQINSSSGSKSIINGKVYSGNNIQINGSQIIIDGVKQEDELTGNITITIQGDCDTVESSMGNITVNGNTRTATNSNGDITVNEDVKGNVLTSNGDVNVKGSITGNVSTSNGDIISHK
jgi:hypothetical protein